MADETSNLLEVGTTAFIILTYLAAVKLLARWNRNKFINQLSTVLHFSHMKARKPLSLRQFMVWYDVYQIVACIFLMKSIQETNVRFWGPYCFATHPDPLNREDERFIELFSYWLKVSEMSETIVFLLRKKNNQVTLLHVFHHCVTVTFVYISHAFHLSRFSFI